MKETTNLVEAMKLASSIFLVGSNMSTIQTILHRQNQSGFLSNEEILTIHSFFFDIMVNHHYNTLQSKIGHATQELVKVVQGDSKEKLPGSEKFTYADLKKLVERIISNPKLSTDIFLNSPLGIPPMMQPPMMQTPHLDQFAHQHHQPTTH